MSSHEQHFRLHGASIRLDSMPVAGRDVDLTPSSDERAALATRLGVTSVDALGLKPDVLEDHPFAALKALKPKEE